MFSTPARLSRSWWQVAALLALATATHGVLDAATDAGLGVGLLSPFDDRRYFWPWRPLATSPIGLGAFFEARSLAILWNELLWVWLPAAAALAVLHARRRARAAGSA